MRDDLGNRVGKRVMRKGLDKMPYGVTNNETVARLAFGCEFDSASAYEKSRLNMWWRAQRWSVRMKLLMRRLFR
jgi:hypothetical protein